MQEMGRSGNEGALLGNIIHASQTDRLQIDAQIHHRKYKSVIFYPHFIS